VIVTIPCEFPVITPIISTIVGDRVPVSAQTTYPIKSGEINPSKPGPGGGAGAASPIADFTASPTSGFTGVAVSFTDTSTNSPATWLWNFGNGTSTEQHPTNVYDTAGTYSVTLTVTNAGGFDSETKSSYITVVDPPTTGPIPEFTASPTSGMAPLTVDFTDASTGTVTTWEWDFDSNGTIDDTTQNPSHSYSTAGTYSVTLTVSDGTTANSQTKTNYINTSVATCTVPNVSDGEHKNEAITLLEGLGFTVVVNGGNGNWPVKSQLPPGGLVVTCGSSVTINDK
jgi:PKD repeat protein